MIEKYLTDNLGVKNRAHFYRVFCVGHFVGEKILLTNTKPISGPQMSENPTFVLMRLLYYENDFFSVFIS